MTHLILARDGHFAWLLGEASAPGALRQPSGGVEPDSLLRWLRKLSARLEAGGCCGSWLIAHDDEIVGLCSFKGLPDANGEVEIGYGVAASRRGRGHATKAVALVIDEVRRAGAVKTLRAETAAENPPSQRVLERNGFVRTGVRRDPDDGDLVLWSLSAG